MLFIAKGIAGGGLTAGIGAAGMFSSPAAEDLDAEIQGTKAMRDYMDNPEEVSTRTASNLEDEEAPAATEKDIQALKNRSGSDFTKEADDTKSNIRSKIGLQKAKTGITDEDIRTSDTFKTDRETIESLERISHKIQKN